MSDKKTGGQAVVLTFVAVYDDVNINKLWFYSGGAFTKDVEESLCSSLKPTHTLKILSSRFDKKLDFFDNGSDICTSMLQYTPFIPKLHRCLDNDAAAIDMILEMLEDMRAGQEVLSRP